MKVYCTRCGLVLAFREDDSTAAQVIHVEPCHYCLDDERRQGYDEGTEDAKSEDA